MCKASTVGENMYQRRFPLQILTGSDATTLSLFPLRKDGFAQNKRTLQATSAAFSTSFSLLGHLRASLLLRRRTSSVDFHIFAVSRCERDVNVCI